MYFSSNDLIIYCLFVVTWVWGVKERELNLTRTSQVVSDNLAEFLNEFCHIKILRPLAQVFGQSTDVAIIKVEPLVSILSVDVRKNG